MVLVTYIADGLSTVNGITYLRDNNDLTVRVADSPQLLEMALKKDSYFISVSLNATINSHDSLPRLQPNQQHTNKRRTRVKFTIKTKRHEGR